MAAQTWDTQLVAQVPATGIANTTSIGVGSVSTVSAVVLSPPYSLAFGVGADPSQLVIAAGSQATTIASLGATKLDFTGPLAGTSIDVVSPTTTS